MSDRSNPSRQLAAATLLLSASVLALHPDTPQVQEQQEVGQVKQRPQQQKTARSHERLPLSKALRKREPRVVASPVPVRDGTLMQVTAYCWTGSRNAAGNWPTLGTAAANAFPLGTHLHVEGYGDVVVEDRSAPGATQVDLYMGSDAGCEARAVQWGRKYLHVKEAA